MFTVLQKRVRETWDGGLECRCPVAGDSARKCICCSSKYFHTPAEHFSHPILKFEPVIDFDGQQLLPSSFVKIYAAVISCVPPSCSVALTAVHILNLTVFPLHYFSSFNRLYKSLFYFFHSSTGCRCSNSCQRTQTR